MKLELSTTLKMMYDDHNQPYYCGRVEFVNQHPFDRITDVNCIVESEMNHGDMDFKIIDLVLLDENQEEVIQDDFIIDANELKEIKKQIYNLIKF